MDYKELEAYRVSILKPEDFAYTSDYTEGFRICPLCSAIVFGYGVQDHIAWHNKLVHKKN